MVSSEFENEKDLFVNPGIANANLNNVNRKIKISNIK
jgi:hypothetical protein